MIIYNCFLFFFFVVKKEEEEMNPLKCRPIEINLTFSMTFTIFFQQKKKNSFQDVSSNYSF